jgi:hypothetical protein
MKRADGGYEVTFDMNVTGPTSFILALIMKKILGRELPPTVAKLVAVAEQFPSRAHSL